MAEDRSRPPPELTAGLRSGHGAVSGARSAWADRRGEFDVLALPGTPICAPPVSEVQEAEIPMSRYTRVANCLDLCAITLPLPRAEGRLPIGFQLCAASGADAFLLALAETVLTILQEN